MFGSFCSFVRSFLLVRFSSFVRVVVNECNLLRSRRGCVIYRNLLSIFLPNPRRGNYANQRSCSEENLEPEKEKGRRRKSRKPGDEKARRKGWGLSQFCCNKTRPDTRDTSRPPIVDRPTDRPICRLIVTSSRLRMTTYSRGSVLANIPLRPRIISSRDSVHCN